MDAPIRYCRTCSYDLRGLPADRCPECGTEFDPADARTWRARPRRGWGRWVRRLTAGMLVIVLVAGGAWTWCWWEWRAEQKALATARGQLVYVQKRMVGPEWLHPRLGRLGFVLERACAAGVDESAQNRAKYTGQPTFTDREAAGLGDLKYVEKLDLRYTNVSDLRPLAKLTRLKMLHIGGTQVRDLSPLAGARSLEALWAWQTPVEDLSPLARLPSLAELDVSESRVSDLTSVGGFPKLEYLDLGGASIVDVRPLGQVTSLRSLYLRDTRVTDVSPLAGLPRLRILYLYGTRVRDLSPLARCTSLRNLYVGPDAESQEQGSKLMTSMPNCRLGE